MQIINGPSACRTLQVEVSMLLLKEAFSAMPSLKRLMLADACDITFKEPGQMANHGLPHDLTFHHMGS